MSKLERCGLREWDEISFEEIEKIPLTRVKAFGAPVGANVVSKRSHVETHE